MPPSKLVRRGCALVLGLAALLALALAVAVWRGRAEPAAWRQQQELLASRTPEEQQELAERAEDRLQRAARPLPAEPGPSAAEPRPLRPTPQTESPAAEAPAPRPQEPRDAPSEPPPSPDLPPPDDPPRARRVTLPLEELNALLQERAARWQAQRSEPLPVGNPVVAIEDGRLVLFLQVSGRGAQMLLGLPVELAVDHGGARVRLLGVRLGQLPLPGLDALPRMLRASGDPQLIELAAEAESAAEGYPFDPRLQLEDGGALRIVGVEVDEAERAVHLTVLPEG